MQAAQFEKYLQAPASMSANDIADLQLLVQEFPYFQAAHVLLTLAGKQHDARVFQTSLRKTAIVASSRTRLFQLVEEIEQATKGATQVQEVEAQKAPEAIEERQILQAAELSTESKTEHTAEEPSDAKANNNEPATAKDVEVVPEEQKLSSVEMLGREIGKEIVTAQVRVEIDEVIAESGKALPEPESFGDWLSYLKKNNGQSYSDITEQAEKLKAKNKEKARERIDAFIEKNEDRKQKNKAIIDSIIEKNPGVIRHKEEQKFFAAENKAKESLLENEHLVTETLARIYALQGSVNKAIRAYEILSLKYPQKSAYFASLIQKLKHNQ